MALKIDMVFREIPVAGAYVWVSMPTVLPSKRQMEFQISYAARELAVPFLGETKTCEYDLDGGINIFEQAYDHLKSLPEFEGATDC